MIALSNFESFLKAVSKSLKYCTQLDYNKGAYEACETETLLRMFTGENIATGSIIATDTHTGVLLTHMSAYPICKGFHWLLPEELHHRLLQSFDLNYTSFLSHI